MLQPIGNEVVQIFLQWQAILDLHPGKTFYLKKIGAATKLKRDKIPRSSHKKYHRKEASNSYEVQYTGRDQN